MEKEFIIKIIKPFIERNYTDISIEESHIDTYPLGQKYQLNVRLKEGVVDSNIVNRLKDLLIEKCPLEFTQVSKIVFLGTTWSFEGNLTKEEMNASWSNWRIKNKDFIENNANA